MEDLYIPDRVVFMNVKDGGVFFDCSPAEARVAERAIKEFRITSNEEDYQARVFELRSQFKECLAQSEELIRDNIVISTGGALTLNALNQTFAILESEGYAVDTIFAHPMRYADIRGFGSSCFDETDQVYQEMTGVKWRLWEADISSNRLAPADSVFVCGSHLDGEKQDKLMIAKIVVSLGY